MAACKHTDKISPSECLGDSLSKINNNFINLDVSLCQQPALINDTGINIKTFVTEQMRGTVSTLPTNSFEYSTVLDSIDGGAIPTTYLLPDATNLKVTKIPYSNVVTGPKPIITFSTVSLTNQAPDVTLFWLADGSNATTVFSLNSATSETARGSIWFNDSVTSIIDVGNELYVGGKFTQVGGNLCEKFAIIDKTIPGGQLNANPIPFLGSVGEVKKIIKTTATKGVATKDIIILAGSFQNSGARGRGLLVYSITDNLVYPFYVNGSVNAIFEVNQILYVGGCFDYVNYGTGSASTFSGQRVDSNGFFMVDLSGLLNGFTKGAISDASMFLGHHATINEFVHFQGTIYLGGEFKVNDSTGNVMCQNACSIDTSGNLLTNWKPIFDGQILTLHIDDTTSLGDSVYIYVGGIFTKHYTSSQFYLQPRPEDYLQTVFYNAAAIQITNTSSMLPSPKIVKEWKPKFSGPVTRFASHDRDPSSHVYCYGLSTTVNDRSSCYLAAITKASAFIKGELIETWCTSIQNGPELINSSLLRDSFNGSLIVGGNFTKVGNLFRYNLAEIGDTDNTYPPAPLSGVNLDFGAQVVSPGLPLTLNLTSNTIKRTSATPFLNYFVNSTTFSVPIEEFKGLTQGQLIRFFVRRPGNANSIGTLPATDDTFKKDIHLIGWKVNFNR